MQKYHFLGVFLAAARCGRRPGRRADAARLHQPHGLAAGPATDDLRLGRSGREGGRRTQRTHRRGDGGRRRPLGSYPAGDESRRVAARAYRSRKKQDRARGRSPGRGLAGRRPVKHEPRSAIRQRPRRQGKDRLPELSPVPRRLEPASSRAGHRRQPGLVRPRTNP